MPGGTIARTRSHHDNPAPHHAQRPGKIDKGCVQRAGKLIQGLRPRPEHVGCRPKFAAGL